MIIGAEKSVHLSKLVILRMKTQVKKSVMKQKLSLEKIEMKLFIVKLIDLFYS